MATYSGKYGYYAVNIADKIMCSPRTITPGSKITSFNATLGRIPYGWVDNGGTVCTTNVSRILRGAIWFNKPTSASDSPDIVSTNTVNTGYITPAGQDLYCPDYMEDFKFEFPDHDGINSSIVYLGFISDNGSATSMAYLLDGTVLTYNRIYEIKNIANRGIKFNNISIEEPTEDSIRLKRYDIVEIVCRTNSFPKPLEIDDGVVSGEITQLRDFDFSDVDSAGKRDLCLIDRYFQTERYGIAPNERRFVFSKSRIRFKIRHTQDWTTDKYKIMYCINNGKRVYIEESPEVKPNNYTVSDDSGNKYTMFVVCPSDFGITNGDSMNISIRREGYTKSSNGYVMSAASDYQDFMFVTYKDPNLVILDPLDGEELEADSFLTKEFVDSNGNKRISYIDRDGNEIGTDGELVPSRGYLDLILSPCSRDKSNYPINTRAFIQEYTFDENSGIDPNKVRVADIQDLVSKGVMEAKRSITMGLNGYDNHIRLTRESTNGKLSFIGGNFYRIKLRRYHSAAAGYGLRREYTDSEGNLKADDYGLYDWDVSKEYEGYDNPEIGPKETPLNAEATDNVYPGLGCSDDILIRISPEASSKSNAVRIIPQPVGANHSLGLLFNHIAKGKHGLDPKTLKRFVDELKWDYDHNYASDFNKYKSYINTLKSVSDPNSFPNYIYEPEESIDNAYNEAINSQDQTKMNNFFANHIALTSGESTDDNVIIKNHLENNYYWISSINNVDVTTNAILVYEGSESGEMNLLTVGGSAHDSSYNISITDQKHMPNGLVFDSHKDSINSKIDLGKYTEDSIEIWRIENYEYLLTKECAIENSDCFARYYLHKGKKPYAYGGTLSDPEGYLYSVIPMSGDYIYGDHDNTLNSLLYFYSTVNRMSWRVKRYDKEVVEQTNPTTGVTTYKIKYTLNDEKWAAIPGSGSSGRAVAYNNSSGKIILKSNPGDIKFTLFKEDNGCFGRCLSAEDPCSIGHAEWTSSSTVSKTGAGSIQRDLNVVYTPIAQPRIIYDGDGNPSIPLKDIVSLRRAYNRKTGKSEYVEKDSSDSYSIKMSWNYPNGQDIDDYNDTENVLEIGKSQPEHNDIHCYGIANRYKIILAQSGLDEMNPQKTDIDYGKVVTKKGNKSTYNSIIVLGYTEDNKGVIAPEVTEADATSFREYCHLYGTMNYEVSYTDLLSKYKMAPNKYYDLIIVPVYKSHTADTGKYLNSADGDATNAKIYHGINPLRIDQYINLKVQSTGGGGGGSTPPKNDLSTPEIRYPRSYPVGENLGESYTDPGRPTVPGGFWLGTTFRIIIEMPYSDVWNSYVSNENDYRYGGLELEITPSNGTSTVYDIEKYSYAFSKTLEDTSSKPVITNGDFVAVNPYLLGIPESNEYEIKVRCKNKYSQSSSYQSSSWTDWSEPTTVRCFSYGDIITDYQQFIRQRLGEGDPSKYYTIGSSIPDISETIDTSELNKKVYKKFANKTLINKSKQDYLFEMSYLDYIIRNMCALYYYPEENDVSNRMDDSYPEWYEKRYYREIIKREHFIHLYSCLCSIVAIVNDDEFMGSSSENANIRFQSLDSFKANTEIIGRDIPNNNYIQEVYNIVKVLVSQ